MNEALGDFSYGRMILMILMDLILLMDRRGL